MYRTVQLLGICVLLTIQPACRKVNNDCNLSAYPNAPDQSWFRFQSGSQEESHGHFILTCSDGGFLQIGETGSLNSSAKILVVKTNSEGALLWKKEFSNGSHNLGNSALEISDGYLVCGSQNRNSSIIKLDKSNGSVIFEKSHDNGGADAFEHVAEYANGLIAVGYVNAADDLNTFYTEGEGYITLLTSAGDKISGENISSQLSHAYRIQSYNNEFFLSGLTDGACSYGLMKLDSMGNAVWTKTFGGDNSDHCFGMDIGSDGSIFLTGHTLSGTANWDTYTMKIDNNGNQLWESKQGNPRGFDPKYIHDEAWGIKATIDGGCVVVAGTGDENGNYKRKCGKDGDNSNTWHVYLVKFDALGNLEWQKTYGSPDREDWAGEDVALTSDGGVVVAVDNGQFGFLKIRPL